MYWGLGLLCGCVAAWLFFKSVVLQQLAKVHNNDIERSLKSIQRLLDQVSDKKGQDPATAPFQAHTIIPNCAVITSDLKGAVTSGYVIPYTRDGVDISETMTPQGMEFRKAIKLFKEKGVEFSILKPLGTMGNLTDSAHHKASVSSTVSNMEFPVNFINLN